MITLQIPYNYQQETLSFLWCSIPFPTGSKASLLQLPATKSLPKNALTQKKLLCTRLVPVPGSSLYPMTSRSILRMQVIKACLLYLNQRASADHANSRAPQRMSFGICCNCITVQLPSALSCFPYSSQVVIPGAHPRKIFSMQIFTSESAYREIQPKLSNPF